MGIEAGLSRTKLVERLRAERDPDVLGEFISHRAWQVRWEAIESLGKTESPAAEGYLLQVLANDLDPGDLTGANAALGRVGSKAAIPAFDTSHPPLGRGREKLGHLRSWPAW